MATYPANGSNPDTWDAALKSYLDDELINGQRDTAANWTSGNPTLAAGQVGIEIDTGKFKIGNGTTDWTSLSYVDHGGLGGLSDDDHTQYVKLAGRSTGQTIIGGTVATANLILQTTSGVGTTGADIHLQVGDNGATRAVTILNNGNVGINNVNPLDRLDILGTGTFGVGFTVAGFAHGITDKRRTDSPAGVQLYDSDGGVYTIGIRKNTSYSASTFDGVWANTTGSTTVPVIRFTASKKAGAGTGVQALAPTEMAAQWLNCTTPLISILGNGNTGFGLTNPSENVHAVDTVRADIAFNLNGKDGVTQAVSTGKVCDVTELTGGIATQQTQITPVADGTYSFYNDGTPGNVTSMTIANGRVTAITTEPA